MNEGSISGIISGDKSLIKQKKRPPFAMKTIGGWICQENAQFPAIFIIL